mmetsp:Transcript_6875/g.14328  ORF Transcript_6875/g.14328 Transcript_6875/m.14328 type:complete len:155 (+) Transcript_6875:355-819(+)
MMARQIMDEVEQMDAEDEIRQQEEDERQQDMDDAEDEMALAPLQGEGAMNHGAGLGIIRNNNVGRGKFIYHQQPLFHYSQGQHTSCPSSNNSLLRPGNEETQQPFSVDPGSRGCLCTVHPHNKETKESRDTIVSRLRQSNDRHCHHLYSLLRFW